MKYAIDKQSKINGLGLLFGSIITIHCVSIKSSPFLFFVMIFIAVNQFKQYLAGLLEAGGGRGLRSVIINGLSTVLDLFPYLWGDFSYFGQLQSKGYFSYT